MNSAKASHPFSSAHSLAQLVIALLAICALIDLIAIVSGYYQVMLLSRALTEETDQITNNGTPEITGTLQLLGRLLALVFFLIWFYCAHRNLLSDALGIVASIVLILIVKKTDARQEEKHRRLTLDAARESEDMVRIA